MSKPNFTREEYDGQLKEYRQLLGTALERIKVLEKAMGRIDVLESKWRNWEEEEEDEYEYEYEYEEEEEEEEEYKPRKGSYAETIMNVLTFGRLDINSLAETVKQERESFNKQSFNKAMKKLLEDEVVTKTEQGGDIFYSAN